MKAVVVTEYGGPEVLHVAEVPEPHAGPGRVRVRVKAAAVNPSDTLFRTGAVRQLVSDAVPHPLRPGMDLAGVLDEVGEGTATDLRIGESVMGTVSPIDATGGARI